MLLANWTVGEQFFVFGKLILVLCGTPLVGFEHMDRPETKPPSPTSSSAYSSPSTQFIALSDDDINLWQAVAIVDERPTAFKEWADSWVAKCDVTPDMVDVWRVGHASVRSGE